jgi:hypothetical protein
MIAFMLALLAFVIAIYERHGWRRPKCALACGGAACARNDGSAARLNAGAIKAQRRVAGLNLACQPQMNEPSPDDLRYNLRTGDKPCDP